MSVGQLPQEIEAPDRMEGGEHAESVERYDERGRPLHERSCDCSTYSPRTLPDDVVRAWCGICKGWIRGGPIPAVESRYARKRRMYREAGVIRPTVGRPRQEGPCKNSTGDRRHAPGPRRGDLRFTLRVGFGRLMGNSCPRFGVSAMRPEVPATGIAAIPGLFAALAAEVVERNRLRARAGGSTRARPSGTVSMWRHPRTRLALGAAAIAFAGWVVAGALGAVIGGATALGFQAIRRRRSRAKRAERLEQQLVEAVSVISSGLRVGQSLVQAIALAGKEVAPPLGPMLAEAADRIALGASFERTMEQWTGRIGTPEARLVAAVLGLHRRTGGDLAALLDRLGNTLRDRLAAAAEVRSLTAQARLSGTILGWLPIGFFVFMATTSRQDISAAYRSPLGATAIALGLLMQGAAYLWIRRLLVVES